MRVSPRQFGGKGPVVIRIELGSEGLARTRFAVSPLHTVTQLLYGLRQNPRVVGRPWQARAAEVLSARRLGLLAAVAGGGPSGYAPDFLAPEPSGYEPSLDEQLHLVACTSMERVRAEMTCAINGHPWASGPGSAPSVMLACAADWGEQRLAARLADELDQFCRMAISPQWSRLRAQMEADIRARTDLIARRGYGAMISGLAPTTRWRDGGFDLALPYQGQLTATAVVLIPGLFSARPLHSLSAGDLPGGQTPLIVYPGHSDSPAPAAALDELIGTTRARLLAELSTPRSTPELAGRLYLSPSTVSYHLQILHRSGLVRRIRRSRQVLYQSIPKQPPAGGPAQDQPGPGTARSGPTGQPAPW